LNYEIPKALVDNHCLPRSALAYAVDFLCVIPKLRSTARLNEKSSNNSKDEAPEGLKIYCYNQDRDEGFEKTVLNIGKTRKNYGDGGWRDLDQQIQNRIASVFCKATKRKTTAFIAS
jgi:hypothetical protein